jgi:choline-sulfatase
MRIVSSLFILLATLPAMAVGPAPAKTAPPDIFLITIDTLRADHVHCYGYQHVQTPALDRLAKDGIRFDHAFTPSPITNSSHISILTGLLPSAHGVTDFGVPLSATHTTLAEVLAKQGYHTAAFIGSVILDSKALAPGIDRGFEFYDNFPSHSAKTSRWGRLERRAGDVVQRAEAWLTAHPKGPHFVWVHLYDPHDPYEPPAPFSQRYKERPYDGEIAYADSALGNFLSYLQQKGWYQKSLVVAVGDHGEGLGEHKEDTHGIFLYDSTTHVPLLVKLPGNEHADGVVEDLVQTIDIFPTVLDLLSMPVPQQVEGVPLQAHNAGEKPSQRTLLAETDYPLRFGWAPLRSARDNTHKFIEAPRPELYDLRADPGEAKNVYEPWNSAVQSDRALLATKIPKVAQSKAAGAVGENTVNELHALGYFGPADAATSTDVPEPSLLPDPKDKIEQQNLLHAAMLAVDEHRVNEARTGFAKALQLDPKSFTALAQLGEIELSAGDYQAAAGHLETAYSLRPDDAKVAFDYARALQPLGRLAPAREALESSLKLNPTNLAGRLLLARIDLDLKDTRAAQDQIDAALLLSPESNEARVLKAELLISENKFSEAAHILEAVTKAQPQSAQPYKLLASAYRGLGRQQEAVRAENQARRLSATDSH